MHFFNKTYFHIPLVSWCLNILIPLVGILVFGWGALEILLLYFYETLIIGFFAVWRILLARGQSVVVCEIDLNQWFAKHPVKPDPGKNPSMDAKGMPKAVAVLFFLIHYGIFLAVIAGFLMGGVLVSEVGQNPHVDIGLGDIFVRPPVAPERRSMLLVSVLGMFVSHAIEFFVRIVQNREHERFSKVHYMIAPYGRVLIQVPVVCFAGTILMAVGAPELAAISLILVKTWADHNKHTWLRRRLEKLATFSSGQVQ